MLERLIHTLEGLPCQPDRVVLLAVSGGMDSMCMADLFLRTGRPFEVLHCNFGLRGADSDADEVLVREWCMEAGVPFHVRHFDTSWYAAEQGVSIEMAARDLRYAWFALESASRGNAPVAVAHHADDNAETLVLNLLRGTGLEGVRGMSPARPLAQGGMLIRPLLGFTRAEIEEYAASNKIPFREDRTNAEDRYLRNKVRHQVLPVFREINPSFLQTLGHDMARFDEAARIVDAWYREHLPSGDRIPFAELFAAGEWRYLLYRLLRDRGFDPSVQEQVADMLSSGRQTAGHLFTGRLWRLALTADALVFEPVTVQDPGPWEIPAPGSYACGGYTLAVSLEPFSPGMPVRCPEGESLFDADLLSFPLQVRRWQAGDWLRPIGLNGSKKLSDLFVDLHFDRLKKEKALVLSGEGSHVYSLLGLRTDESVRVTEQTANVLRIRIR